MHGEFVLILFTLLLPIFFSHAQIIKQHSCFVRHLPHFLSDIFHTSGFEQPYGETPQSGHVCRAMSSSDLASILIINGINDVMATIFNHPVTPIGCQYLFRAGLLRCLASVLSRRRAYHQRVLAGCAARRASAGLAVANSNEYNAAACPPELARREPSCGVAPLAKSAPLAARRALPCFLGMALMVCSSTEQDTSDYAHLPFSHVFFRPPGGYSLALPFT